MNWPLYILSVLAAFALGGWLGRRQLQTKLKSLSDELKLSADKLAEGVKRNQP